MTDNNTILATTLSTSVAFGRGRRHSSKNSKSQNSSSSGQIIAQPIVNPIAPNLARNSLGSSSTGSSLPASVNNSGSEVPQLPSTPQSLHRVGSVLEGSYVSNSGISSGQPGSAWGLDLRCGFRCDWGGSLGGLTSTGISPGHSHSGKSAILWFVSNLPSPYIARDSASAAILCV